MGKDLQIWDLWYPKAAATGLAFARGRLDAADVLLVHAAPEVLTVEVRSEAGALLARAADLPQTADRPMARLTRQGERINRADVWPAAEDIGRPVILPGGEVGLLLRWWNAEDGSAWRWAIELYNER
jgi:hypothetical protein